MLTLLRSLGERPRRCCWLCVPVRLRRPGSAAGDGTGGAPGGPGNGSGLEYTVIVSLIPLVFAGLLSLIALRTYPPRRGDRGGLGPGPGDAARRDDRDLRWRAASREARRPAGDAGT